MIKAGDSIQQYNYILARQLNKRRLERSQILDVRKESEWKAGVLDNSQLISLSELEKCIQELPKDKTIYICRKLGGRSLISYSILASKKYMTSEEVLTLQ